MSILTELESIGKDIGSFFKGLKNDVTKAEAVWQTIADPGTRAFVVQVAGSVLSAVKDGTLAVSDKGLNFAVDEALFNDAKNIIAEAKTGSGIVEKDVQLLIAAFKPSKPVATTPVPATPAVEVNHVVEEPVKEVIPPAPIR